MSDQEVVKLLAEIRDTQKALLEEYRRVANAALTTQKEAFEKQKMAIEQQARAVTLQAQAARLYKVVVAVAALAIAFLIYKLLAYL